MIFLARHGQTPYNAEGRFQGRLPVPLSDLGREQARALAAVCAQRTWSTFWCSPLARARQTAAIVGEAIGMTPVVDERLAETDTGDWTDLTFAEATARWPERFAAWQRHTPGFAFPGGESFEQQGDRVMAALADIATADPAGPSLVVCHRQVIRLALALRTGDPALRTSHVENAALVELPAT